MSLKSTFKVALVAALTSVMALAPSANALSSSSSSGGSVVSPPAPVVTSPAPSDNTSYTKTINQGNEIYTYNTLGQAVSSCTVGYVGKGYALTAGHCGEEGGKVTDNNFSQIGHIVKVDMERNQDIAIIKLDNGVGGKNTYSGDYITSFAELSPNDEICQYGNTTKKVLCSPMHGLPRYGAFWSKNTANYGDSGGAMWVKNKGLIGIVSSKGDSWTYGTEAWITVNKYPDFKASRAAGTTNYLK